MKKFFKYFIVIVFTIFSFYYTENVIEGLKTKDPLMQKIDNKKNSFDKKASTSSFLNGDLLLGENGVEIDKYSSYEKMKSVNTYNDDLLEYKIVEPTINLKNSYNYPIIGKTSESKKIAIIFFLEDLKYLDDLNTIVSKYDINTTIYIDGKYIEKNLVTIKNDLNKNISIGLYSYDNLFNFHSVNYLNRLYKNLNYDNYCLYKDDKFLKLCASFEMNTVKPEIIDKNIYNFFKNKKEIGRIYRIDIQKSKLSDIDISINYLIQKGYTLCSIKQLLEE